MESLSRFLCAYLRGRGGASAISRHPKPSRGPSAFSHGERTKRTHRRDAAGSGSRRPAVIFVLQTLATVVVLGLLGLPASLWAFRERPLFARICTAPAIGVAVASVVFFTAARVMPMSEAAWVILLPWLIAAAVIVALWARRQPGLLGRLRSPAVARRSAWTLGAVLMAIASPAIALGDLGSRGPIGYLVNDATGGYPAILAWLQRHSLSDPKPWGPDWNVMLHYGSVWAGGFQQGGLEAVAAAIASLFGWSTLAFESALLGALIVIGGLAMAGLVCSEFTPAPSYLPAAAVALYAGPVTLHLFIEGSEAALAGLSVLPLALLCLTGVRVGMGVRGAVALTLVLGGLQTVYPLTYPFVVGGALVVAFLVLLLGVAQNHRPWRTAASPMALVALAVAASLVLSPVALARNIVYWHRVATGGFLDQLAPIFPQYDLGFSVAIPWLTQLRPFPYFKDTATAKPWLVVLSTVAIVVLSVSMVQLIRTTRVGLPIAAIGGFAAIGALVAAGALVTGANSGCAYCAQRSAVVIAPLVLLILLFDIAALAASTRRLGRIAAPLTMLCLLGAAGAASASLTSRVIEDGYALPTSALDAATRLRDLRGTVLLEGANGSYYAVHEFPAFTYAAAMSGHRISFVRGDDFHFGLAFSPSTAPDAEFTPSYHLVLSRFGAVATDRRTVARYGPFAVQERVRPLDTVIVAGVVAERADRDPSGRAWVDGRLVVRVMSARRIRAHVDVTLRQEGAEVVDSRGRIVPLRPGVSTVCVDAGIVSNGYRDAVLRLLDLGGPLPGPSEFSLRARPNHQVELLGIAAASGQCRSGL
jgi:hypothetical protein